MKSLLLLTLLIAGCAEARPSHSAPYAVRLEFEGGAVCSATAVGRNILLGASHCWGDADKTKRRLSKVNGQDAYALEIVRDGADHSLVRVSTQFPRWAVMGPEPKVGDRLTMHGNIGGVGLMYREVVVSGDVTRDSCNFASIVACRLILIDGTTGGGDSGSGYFDSRGRLVAVHTGAWLLGGFHLRVAIPLAFTDKNWRDIRS